MYTALTSVITAVASYSPSIGNSYTVMETVHGTRKYYTVFILSIKEKREPSVLLRGLTVYIGQQGTSAS
jgi:hypothetical protein